MMKSIDYLHDVCVLIEKRGLYGLRYYLLDQALTQRATQFESDRQATLAKISAMLQKLGLRYGVERAWIFGSVTRPHRFTEDSDIDLAVEQIRPADFSMLLARLVAI